jgi:hypothetical protein
MTAKTMAEVLAEHYIDITQTSPDNIGRCVCGYTADPMNVSWDEHLAETLSAAGFGLVADAKAEALEEAADEAETLGIVVINPSSLRARAATVRGEG